MNMARLDEDLEQGNLALLMEPQYCIEQQRITGYEVSAHWLHPSEGLVDPARMLSAQDDVKRIAQIERFALQQGLSEIKRLRELSDCDYTVSVDLSGASVGDPSYKDKLIRMCEQEDFPANDLTVEFNEQIIRFDEADSLEGRSTTCLTSAAELRWMGSGAVTAAWRNSFASAQAF